MKVLMSHVQSSPLNTPLLSHTHSLTHSHTEKSKCIDAQNDNVRIGIGICKDTRQNTSTQEFKRKGGTHAPDWCYWMYISRRWIGVSPTESSVHNLTSMFCVAGTDSCLQNHGGLLNWQQELVAAHPSPSQIGLLA